MPQHRIEEEQALRDGVYDRVLRLVLSGETAPGAKLRESELAKKLDVSRTPLREALLLLERDGLIRSDHNRGFSVAGLSADEARELYPILWTLESLALRSTGAAAGLAVGELRRINETLKQSARRPARALVCDLEWHEAVLRRCPNRALMELVRRQRRLVERYERLFMAESDEVQHSVAQHEEVAGALEADDLTRACRALEANWKTGLDWLLSRLKRGD